ncbi:B3 domain-containing transcription repressor VAL2 [Striga hermonthica]|uniref:B3 domain-containing transcription repressor VAL2 n=1 Tax=Striga hermonthica TaxID=68872 RepID=A0A9N7MTJ2_STRHE|nr:B3 domain-containing transcription repressor VAL2 [Striga hermonthica]
MASSSRMSCFQCHDSSSAPDAFRNGWRLRSGHHAHLCPRCASLYEEGRFCETYHLHDDGWRDCESCGKSIHCGCIASFNSHFLLDVGGIICMECSRLNFLLARNQCMPLDPDTTACESGSERSGKALAEAQFWPRVTDLEMPQFSRIPNATVTPLFEKILTTSDADLKLARLIIPKRCAESSFPNISGPHGLHIKIQDMEGSEWEFHYRYWINGGSRIYVLEGLRDYMVSKNWQAGDTVLFGAEGVSGKASRGLGLSRGEAKFKFFGPRSEVRGLVGQTFRSIYKNPSSLGLIMAVVGGKDDINDVVFCKGQ